MPKKILELPNESVLNEIVLKALSLQSQPVTARKLMPRPFKLPEDRLIELLTRLVTKGKIFEWPANKGKGKPRYWHQQLSPEFISKRVLDRLAEKPLTSSELNKELFGIPKTRVDPVIHSLLFQGVIVYHPKRGSVKIAKWGLQPPDPKPYLQKVQKELDQVFKMLAPSRVSREDIHKALFDLLGIYAPPKYTTEGHDIKDLEAQILSKMVEIEPQAPYGALVSLRNLRRSLDFEKELFDRTIIDLAKKNRIILHQHSFPQGLSEAERNFLVEDQKGHWYVGAVLMDKQK